MADTKKRGRPNKEENALKKHQKNYRFGDADVRLLIKQNARLMDCLTKKISEADTIRIALLSLSLVDDEKLPSLYEGIHED